jgi:hypothetical protein
VLYNRTFRAVSVAQGLSLAEDARLFAMMNISAADGFVACWADKGHWGFWRPITAIRAGDSDGNKGTPSTPASIKGSTSAPPTFKPCGSASRSLSGSTRTPSSPSTDRDDAVRILGLMTAPAP